MPEQQRVNIAHRDGREYSIRPADFTNARVSPEGKSYAEQGFRIVGHVDGTPYDGPATQREIDQAAEERRAAREAKAAEKTPDDKGGGKAKGE